MFRNVVAVTALATGCLLVAGKTPAQTTAPDFLPNPERLFSDPDPDLKLLRQDLRLQKKQIIAANVALTDAQAQKFWPAYDQFELEFARIYDKKVAVVQEYCRNNDTESYLRGRAASTDK